MLTKVVRKLLNKGYVFVALSYTLLVKSVSLSDKDEIHEPSTNCLQSNLVSIKPLKIKILTSLYFNAHSIT